MNANEETKGKLRNFTFVKSADERLLELQKETGKTMTSVLEDLLLGRRQFRPDIEKFIAEQMEKFNQSRQEILEAALYVAMKFSAGQMPDAREHDRERAKAKAVGGSSAAVLLAAKSGKKQKVAPPSENKPSREASG